MIYSPSINIQELKRLEKKLTNGTSSHYIEEANAIDRLKEIEAKLAAKEKESAALNNALNAAFRGVARVSPDGKYLYLNEAYATMLDSKVEDLLDTHISKTIHPEDLSLVLEELEKVKQGGKGEACVRGLTSKGCAFKKIVIMVPDKESGGNWCFMNNIDSIRGLDG